MQSELIEDAVPALAGMGIGAAGHGMNVQFVGQSEDVGGVALIVDQVRAEITSAEVQALGEAFAVANEEFGLEFVAGGNPGIVTGLTPTFANDEPAGRGPGPADLSGFLGQLEAG